MRSERETDQFGSRYSRSRRAIPHSRYTSGEKVQRKVEIMFRVHAAVSFKKCDGRQAIYKLVWCVDNEKYNRKSIHRSKI